MVTQWEAAAGAFRDNVQIKCSGHVPATGGKVADDTPDYISLHKPMEKSICLLLSNPSKSPTVVLLSHDHVGQSQLGN